MSKHKTNQEGYIIERKDKYLEDLGLKPEEYGINFMESNTSKERLKKWKKQRKEYGFDERETWNLHVLSAEWLYSHIKMYLDYTPVDLSFYKFDFEDKTYTQEQAIRQILKWLSDYILNRDTYNDNLAEECYKNAERAWQLWALIFPVMWW